MMRKNMLIVALLGALILGSVIPAYATLTVSTNKAQYYVGDALTINVAGGTASGIVLVQVSTGSNVIWAVQDVFTAGGGFTTTFIVPSTMSVGTYTVTVKDNTAKTSIYTTFDVIATAPAPTNSPPVASISGPADAIEGDSVTFSGSGSTDSDGTVIGYTWTWGDGGESAGVSASHIYSAAGSYTITLRVTDDKGATGTASALITIRQNQAPTALISGAADGRINEAVSFTGTGTDVDGTISGYSWTFGDSSTGSGSSITHIYTVAGTYEVTLTVTDNKGKTGSATTSVRIYNPPPPVEEIIADTPEDAAALIEETHPEDAAAILEEIPTQDAAAIVELLTPEHAADIIIAANTTEAALIVEEVPPEAAVVIIEAAVAANNTEQISQVVLAMDNQAAAQVLVQANTDQAAVVIEAMATQNLNDAAQTVEDAIKLFIQELDPEQQAAIQEQVKATLENVSVESLVNLFIEIANLPNTPSTVAAMFETFDLAKTLQVVTGIGEQGAWTELGKIFGFLSQGSLNTIYSAMPSAQRAALSPYLSAQTVAMLPKIGTYQVSALAVTPATAALGATVTVTATVRNVGTEAGTHDVVLKVGGVAVQMKTVALNAGQSATVTYSVTAGAAGTYSVAVESQSGSFKVEAAGANISVTSVTLSKTSVAAGEQVTATVTLSNTGAASGEYALTVTLDGVQKYSESVTVAAGATATKTYTLFSDVVGGHTVAAGGKSAQFTVATPPPSWMDYIWYIVGALIILTALAYYLLVMRKKA